MTILEYAKSNSHTDIMKSVAKAESLDLKVLISKIARGAVIIPSNKRRALLKPCGIGEGLSTKVNANIGTSRKDADLGKEFKKLEAALGAGCDAIMDLSTGGDLKKIRESLLAKCPVPFGTVPIYEVASGIAKIKDIKEKDILNVLKDQAKSGVDFFTVHSGINLETLKVLKNESRVMDVVSRGGAILIQWMLENKKENPFFEYFDEIIDIAKEFDVTLSLGDGMRPGSVSDSTDSAQIQELITLGELAKRAYKKGVQVMIEGPGHVPINEIEINVKLEKSLCNNAPFYVLGPIVTDIAPGYDHITSSIGGAIAAGYGADFLCYVTPSEHLALPDVDDVRLGVTASKIAAHAGDLAKGIPGAMEKDIAMSKARKERDWEKQFKLAVDGIKPRQYMEKINLRKGQPCTMCDELCSLKLMEGCL